LIESPLKHERQDKLKEAKIAAFRLEKIIVSNIYGPNTINRKFKYKSRKRILKIIRKLKTNMDSQIPAVISDKSKVSELHQVRKDTKKLRYVIELLLISKEYEEKDNRVRQTDVVNPINKDIRRILAYLEKLQDILGDIHDYDITLEYLKKKQKADKLIITNTITNIQNIRNTKFDQFVDYIRSLTL
jgi:CHAD domain-containing protein